MIQGVAFCYDKMIGPPHPIIGTLESESIWFQDRKLAQTAKDLGVNSDDVGRAMVTKDKAELLLGITGVPDKQVIDLANITYDPKTDELTMVYKDDA